MHFEEADASHFDWSAHLLPKTRRMRGPGLHLSEAFSRAGHALVEYWTDEHLLSFARPCPPDDIPHFEAAFRLGVPVSEVHDTWGPHVRAILSPGRWASIQSRLRNVDRWLAEHVIDPDGGLPVHPQDLRARAGEDVADPISEENWECAWDRSSDLRALSVSDRKAVDHVLHAIVEMAGAGTLRFLGRSADGAEIVGLPSDIWHGEYSSRLRTLAECRVVRDLEGGSQSYDLFIDENGFHAALVARAETDFLPAIRENHPWLTTDEHSLDEADRRLNELHPRSLTRHPIVEQQVRTWLRTFLPAHARDNWKLIDIETIVMANPDFHDHRHHLARVATALGKEFATVERFNHLTAPGQPSKRHPRPSTMERSELLRLVTGK